MNTEKQPPPEQDFTESSELPPPVYEVEEELVERRINSDGKFVQVIDDQEVVIERRQSNES